MQFSNFWFETGTVVVSFIMGGILVFMTNIKKMIKPTENLPILVDCDKLTKENSRIHEILTELRIVSNCNRASISQFHNGGHFLDGSSMLKSSITHESSDILTLPTITDYQGILLSRFNVLMNILHKNNISIQYVREMKSSLCKYFMESKGVEIFAVVSIYSLDGLNIIGYASVEWTDVDIKINNDLVHKQMLETQRLLQIFLNTKKGF